MSALKVFSYNSFSKCTCTTHLLSLLCYTLFKLRHSQYFNYILTVNTIVNRLFELEPLILLNSQHFTSQHLLTIHMCKLAMYLLHENGWLNERGRWTVVWVALVQCVCSTDAALTASVHRLCACGDVLGVCVCVCWFGVSLIGFGLNIYGLLLWILIIQSTFKKKRSFEAGKKFHPQEVAQKPQSCWTVVLWEALHFSWVNNSGPILYGCHCQECDYHSSRTCPWITPLVFFLCQKTHAQDENRQSNYKSVLKHHIDW